MTQDNLFPLPSEPTVKKEPRQGTPRISRPNRGQIEWRPIAVDGMLPEDHVARVVWAFVEGVDLSELYDRVQAMEQQPGRPAIDPKILMALWILATLDGIGAAAEIDRYCLEHAAYRWICGGVSVNAHTISDFRRNGVETFRRVLVHSVAVLMQQGLVDLSRVAQDGMRVRAHAGAASFRRKATLEECLRDVEAYVKELQEADADDGTATRRQRAARMRAAQDRQARIQEAIRQLPEIEAIKQRKRKKGEEITEKNAARASTTDPDARPMKMPDGGFRPAFNMNLATDTTTQIIVGVDVSNSGTDYGKMPPMIDKIEENFGLRPKEMLVDGGYAGVEDIELASAKGTKVYAPVNKRRSSTIDLHAPRKGDSEAIAEWRARMGTVAAKEIYKERAATAECVNALARRRGLSQILVRGIEQALGVTLLAAIAHNVFRAISLSG